MTEKQLRHSRAYDNMVSFLDDINYECLISKTEYYKKYIVSFKCFENHISILNRQTYNNKKDLYKKQSFIFCAQCKKLQDIIDNKKIRMAKILELVKPYNHTILHLHDDCKKIEMKCGNCEYITTTNFQTINRDSYTGSCIKCMNVINRKPIEKVKQELNAIGIEMFDNEYKSNKQVTAGCSECDIQFTRALHDIKRRIIKHYHCSNCLDGVSGKSTQFEPLCFRCYCYEHPDEIIPFRFKMKEHFFTDALKDYLETMKSDINIDYQPPVFDKIIDNSCSRRRPDVLIDCYTHCVILELDENQHFGYSCENKRICELFQDLGSRPLVVLRLNPDSYKDGVRHQGCFHYRKGKISIRKKEWNNRCLRIFSKMSFYMQNIPSKEITVESFCFSTL
jgi:hypothetical protein